LLPQYLSGKSFNVFMVCPLCLTFTSFPQHLSIAAIPALDDAHTSKKQGANQQFDNASSSAFVGEMLAGPEAAASPVPSELTAESTALALVVAELVSV